MAKLYLKAVNVALNEAEIAAANTESNARKTKCTSKGEHDGKLDRKRGGKHEGET